MSALLAALNEPDRPVGELAFESVFPTGGLRRSFLSVDPGQARGVFRLSTRVSGRDPSVVSDDHGRPKLLNFGQSSSQQAYVVTTTGHASVFMPATRAVDYAITSARN